jgi:hypothetical protein
MIFLLNLFSQNDANGQIVANINFEDSSYTNPSLDFSFYIDTTDTNNIWQIGQPQKNVFNQAWSTPNAIVTNLMNTYPTNDTSAFYVKYFVYNTGNINGRYWCNTDSLNDYGLIELSNDNGQTWINLLNDSLSVAHSSLPTLTGNSGGWDFFSISFEHLLPNPSNGGDSVLVMLRLSFISDSIDTQHDGLMFDNLQFYILLNTENLYELNNLKVFPNPTSDILNFQFDEPIEDGEIRIYSSIGQLMKNQNIKNTDVRFDVSDWNSGMYFYGIYIEGRLVKQGQVLIQN